MTIHQMDGLPGNSLPLSINTGKGDGLGKFLALPAGDVLSTDSQ